MGINKETGARKAFTALGYVAPIRNAIENISSFASSLQYQYMGFEKVVEEAQQLTRVMGRTAKVVTPHTTSGNEVLEGRNRAAMAGQRSPAMMLSETPVAGTPVLAKRNLGSGFPLYAKGWVAQTQAATTACDIIPKLASQALLDSRKPSSQALHTQTTLHSQTKTWVNPNINTPKPSCPVQPTYLSWDEMTPDELKTLITEVVTQANEDLRKAVKNLQTRN